MYKKWIWCLIIKTFCMTHLMNKRTKSQFRNEMSTVSNPYKIRFFYIFWCWALCCSLLLLHRDTLSRSASQKNCLWCTLWLCFSQKVRLFAYITGGRCKKDLLTLLLASILYLFLNYCFDLILCKKTPSPVGSHLWKFRFIIKLW